MSATETAPKPAKKTTYRFHLLRGIHIEKGVQYTGNREQAIPGKSLIETSNDLRKHDPHQERFRLLETIEGKEKE